MRNIYIILFLLAAGIASSFAQTMDWLCHPGEYSDIRYAGNGLFKIRNSQGKWGLLAANGEMRVEAKYDSITSFRESRALLLDKSGRRLLGLVDSDGNIIKDFATTEIYVSSYPYFREGRLAFAHRVGLRTNTSFDENGEARIDTIALGNTPAGTMYQDKEWGYLNDKGNIAIAPIYQMAAPFQNGIAAVKYNDTDYALINKSGHFSIVSDDLYPFISSPVDGKVLVIKNSRRGGNQLVLMRIEDARLKKEKVLEDGMFITPSDDLSTIECQLGHTYYLDNQLRVVSSSHGSALPQVAEDPQVVTESTTVLSKVASEGGMKITYLGNPIMDYAFPDVETFDKTYAVVRSKDGKVGVLRLNPSAAITIKSPDTSVTLRHNEPADVMLDVELVDVDPSKIKWYRNDQGWLTQTRLEQVNGMWKLRMPYFRPSESYDVETTESVDIAITYDGLDWMHQFVDVTSRHQPGYDVVLRGSDVTGAGGSATLTLHVTAIDSKSAKGTISINGGTPVAFSNGEKSIPLTVSVPQGSTKTFSYTVVVTEDGCPPYTTQVTKTVSNPVRKQATPPKKEKKKSTGIIII